ncbi:MAG: molybdopterin-dependent oxidoreductase [Ignisphaera sp.]
MASRIVCPFCGYGCSIYINKENGSAYGYGCFKGSLITNLTSPSNRVLYPYVRRGDIFSEATWNSVLNDIATELRKIVKVYGGSSIAFIGCSQCSNEENYLIQKLARFLGSNNIDNCARLCHAISVDVLAKSLGFGAQTNPFSDLLYSKAILIIGYNPVATHPPLAALILEAKKRGAKIIVIDVRRSETAELADIFIQIGRPGEDYKLLLCMANIIISSGLYNKRFVHQMTEGFEGFYQIAKRYDISKCRELGVESSLVEEVAREFASAGCGSILWGMGITQHVTAKNNVSAIVNLALLLGYIGRRGCGLYPVRGQSNVQGACDMGALPNYLPGYVRVDDEYKKRLFQDAWNIDNIPSEPGYTSIEIFEKALKGDIRALFIIGENPVLSHPNSTMVRKALQNIELVVVHEIRWSETTQYADYVLPVATRLEKEGSYTNSERRVQWSYKILDPPGKVLPDWVIVEQLGRMIGLDSWREYGSVEDITIEISSVVPIYRGITPQKLKENENGVIWPCENGECTSRLYQNRFETPLGKAIFSRITDKEEDDKREYLILTTYRSSLCYNTSLCIDKNIDIAIINRFDAKAIGIDDGDVIEIETECGKEIFYAKTNDKVPRGVVAIPWHRKANMVTCTKRGSDNGSYTQPLKSIRITNIKIVQKKKAIK